MTFNPRKVFFTTSLSQLQHAFFVFAGKTPVSVNRCWQKSRVLLSMSEYIEKVFMRTKRFFGQRLSSNFRHPLYQEQWHPVYGCPNNDNNYRYCDQQHHCSQTSKGVNVFAFRQKSHLEKSANKGMLH